ncbi:MAG: cytochrome C [Paracoccus sp. (in: a-proteobacteria)]|uniref:cytochrome C n=1 Tax=Paracoccus sp. TaxID=267 RepID=UPI0026E05B4A|nr:cytochrome C [Paracoccus sp. (in: a-proteobacteria)]MDO5631776.1 cytochrome C [Paracoccus sp. (in: a-proteobacteria)]
MTFPAKYMIYQAIAITVAAWLPVAALAQDAATEQATDAEPAPAYTLPSVAPLNPEQIRIGNAAEIAAWARSGHADAASRSFTYWNEAGTIPPVCAACHSGAGFRAYHGLDGSPGGEVPPVPVGGVVDCDTCHNPGIGAIREVRLPTGMMHPVGGGEASCVTCHQGRASGSAIAEAVAQKAEDLPNADLSFINPHYGTAAAMALGGYAGLGYEYEGKTYDGRFTHAPPVQTCAACHDPHSLEVATDSCQTCHGAADAMTIRLSRQSHDGSGDVTKGIGHDIAANAFTLKQVIFDYAREVAGMPMIYDAGRHPYFFADANDDGVIDEADGARVAYNAWTPRLLKAAYNWKFVTSDKGAHVHNPHYALQLLYDSTEDLTTAMGRDFARLGWAR